MEYFKNLDEEQQKIAINPSKTKVFSTKPLELIKITLIENKKIVKTTIYNQKNCDISHKEFSFKFLIKKIKNFEYLIKSKLFDQLFDRIINTFKKKLIIECNFEFIVNAKKN